MFVKRLNIVPCGNITTRSDFHGNWCRMKVVQSEHDESFDERCVGKDDTNVFDGNTMAIEIIVNVSMRQSWFDVGLGLGLSSDATIGEDRVIKCFFFPRDINGEFLRPRFTIS